MADLDALREALAAATPAPWSSFTYRFEDGSAIYGIEHGEQNDRVEVVTLGGYDHMFQGGIEADEDAALIVLLRNNAGSLLDTLDTVTSVGQWRDELLASQAIVIDRLEAALDTVTAQRDQAVAALRALDAVTFNRGHRPSPLDGEGVLLVTAANKADRDPAMQRSLKCWDCAAGDDQPRDPYNAPDGPTWGDASHDRWAAWLNFRAVLASLDPERTPDA